jgi:hypothetical protein
MVEKLDYIDYCLPQEIRNFKFSFKNNLTENYTEFLNYLIYFMDPYLNVKDIEKIRPYLINDLAIFFGLPRFNPRILSVSEFLELLCKNLVFMLRKTIIELFVIIQMFSQVIQDNNLYDDVLELLQLNPENPDEILEILSLPSTELEIIYGEEIISNLRKILLKEKLSMKDLFLNILKTL